MQTTLEQERLAMVQEVHNLGDIMMQILSVVPYLLVKETSMILTASSSLLESVNKMEQMNDKVQLQMLKTL